MKNFIILVVLLLLVFNCFAQAPDLFNHQVIVRDANNAVISNQVLGIQISLMQGNDTGPVVYQETFSQSSNANGLLNLSIGAGTVVNGDLSSIDWNNGPYYIESAIDPDNGTNYSIFSIAQFQSMPYALYSNRTGFASGADFNSLDNQPQLITNAQSDKINFLTINAALNLDLLDSQVDLNNVKVSFPGFGTTAGTAYEILWNKINNDAFYLPGNVGLGVPSIANFGGSVLHVAGGILYDGVPGSTTPGLLYYDPENEGSFCYFDELSNKQTIGRNIAYRSSGWNGIYELIPPTPPITYDLLRLKTSNNVIAKGRMAVGHGALPGYNFTGNTMTLVGDKLRIKFWDTSTTGAFPSADWQIVINDPDDGEDNYFAIADTTSVYKTPFKLMAGTPDHSLYMNESGKVGIGTNLPAEALDVTGGTIEATVFLGNADQLTGLSGTATGSVANTGSTTLAADTDANSGGYVNLQTKNTTRLVVANSGNIGIANNAPANALDVGGTGAFTNEVKMTESLKVSGQLQQGIYNDPTIAATTFSDYDAAGKNIIYFNPTSGNISLWAFISGVSGQRITLINTSPTNNLTIVPNMFVNQYITGLTGTFSLGQYESATLVFVDYRWIVTDRVN